MKLKEMTVLNDKEESSNSKTLIWKFASKKRFLINLKKNLVCFLFQTYFLKQKLTAKHQIKN
jgi:hypothetical protein